MMDEIHRYRSMAMNVDGSSEGEMNGDFMTLRQRNGVGDLGLRKVWVWKVVETSRGDFKL